MSDHPELDCVIIQMKSLEHQLAANSEIPVTSKDLLPLCEAVRMIASLLKATSDQELVTAGDTQH